MIVYFEIKTKLQIIIINVKIGKALLSLCPMIIQLFNNKLNVFYIE